MRNRWAQGIEPRNFMWVLKDQLAISERPGGYSRNHRPVRRQEEIIWLRQAGFDRVVSLLPTSHNLQAYEDLEVVSSHLPFASDDDPRVALAPIFETLQRWLDNGEKLLMHREEVGDEMMGIIASYLLWSRRIDTSTKAVSLVERLMHKQMGPAGRRLVASYPAWSSASH